MSHEGPRYVFLKAAFPRLLRMCAACGARAGDEVYPAQKDRSNPVTQCHVWMANISPSVLMIVDLEGGTLLDWWNTHIRKVGVVVSRARELIASEVWVWVWVWCVSFRASIRVRVLRRVPFRRITAKSVEECPVLLWKWTQRCRLLEKGHPSYL